LVAYVVGSLCYVVYLARSWEQYEEQSAPFAEQSIAQYMRDRQRFITTCDGADEDFHYFEYRKITISQEFCNLIELQPLDWAIGSVLLGVLFVLMRHFDHQDYLIFVFFCWIFFVVCVLEIVRLRSILSDLRALEPVKQEGAYGTFGGDEPELRPPYLSHPIPTPRSSKVKMVLGVKGDRHRALIWPGVRGPEVMRVWARVRFLISAITWACLISFYASSLQAHGFLFVVGAILPMFLASTTLPVAVIMMAEITSIEEMKREEVVCEVSRCQRAQRSFQLLKTLATMTSMMSKTGGGGSPRVSLNRQMSAKEQAFLDSLKEMFISFDCDHSNTMELDEFQEMMKYTAPTMAADDVVSLFKEMDDDGSGQVSFEELAGVMLAHYAEMTSASSAELSGELGERLWVMFDTDNSGTVNLEEVMEALQKTGAKWDLSNVVALFNEIDHDSSGTIDKSEFIHYVTKHGADGSVGASGHKH